MTQTDIIAKLTSSDFPVDPDHDWKIVIHESIPPIQAKLSKVLNHIPREGDFRQGFSLTFVTELKTLYYPQGTYTLIHPEFGNLPLFMVPVGKDKDGFILYEIIFN